MDWIQLAQDRDQWRALVSAVMNLWVSWNAGRFLSSRTIDSFSRRPQLHEWVSEWVRCWDATLELNASLPSSVLFNLALLVVLQLGGVLFCGAPSLTRGRVYLLYMLLALSSEVFLGSESLGTRDHILLSQIWYFPFRRLLLLAGSGWRYSSPPLHGLNSQLKSKSHCDWRSVSQQVLLSSPIWGLCPDIYYCLTVTVCFFWWGARVIACISKSFVIM
jgi:hypothetical protein